MDRTDEQKKILEKQRQEMIEQKVRNKGRSERGVKRKGRRREKKERNFTSLHCTLHYFLRVCCYVLTLSLPPLPLAPRA